MQARRWVVGATIGAFALVGCSTTVDDATAGEVPADDPAQDLSDAELTGGEGRDLADDDTSPLDSGVIVDPVTPPTSDVIAGSTADLLLAIGVDMSRLSAEIGDADGEDATIARIESTWASIRPDVEATHPELVNSIQATVDMARNAVDTKRPADADKAFALLNDLVDNYTGDG